ncbi:MAG: YhcH/YjgK/YiaL family protein [Phycisphaerales bacterium]|nr:YhcH/YjgK/YiaL family protein [Phycisphaerales bacterium]
MIFDKLENAAQYADVAATIRRGIDFLRSSNPIELPLGRIEIDGENVFALVQEYETKPPAECRWESHRIYCDIQCVARGMERFGVTQHDRVTITEFHDTQRDIAFYSGEGDYLMLRPGMFLILWPHDVHMPCIAPGDSTFVRKIVVKARIA